MSNNSLTSGMNFANEQLVNAMQTNKVRAVEEREAVVSSEIENVRTVTQTDDTNKVTAVTEAEKQELANATEELTQMMAMTRKSISFEVNENSNEPIVSVRDADSGEVIRQIPSEEALKIAERIAEMRGLLLDEIV
ncbi:flagellar protein FlaG [Parashewanella curva]|uniref:Flagellar protein FlaG n=1 Tax=Parashewanella curva TaxID=2338552 RepID=A0A3L8Q354_9GAMM|nr:flagellar protein FlaG [Parashewanella curva]RLV61558.1 flagellar protein FlaG [Parashewanella curva]